MHPLSRMKLPLCMRRSATTRPPAALPVGVGQEMPPPSLPDQRPLAAYALARWLARSNEASVVSRSSNGGRHGGSSPGADVRQHRVTPPVPDSPEFSRRACPPALWGPRRHCRRPCDGHRRRTQPEDRAGEPRVALAATVTRSTWLSPLSSVRLLPPGPGGQETARCSADCRLALGRSAWPTSSRYSCANPTCGLSQLPEGTTT